MRERISSIVTRLKPYFEQLLCEDPTTGDLYVQDDELGDRASCCTQGQVACFFLLDDHLNGGGNGKDIAARLAADVRRRQLPNGAFGQPYYVKQGEAGTVDIAEIGAVANSLYHIARITESEDARHSLDASAAYLLTQIATENPGAVYKNPNAKGHDVLNGDMYAAHTWGRAYELTGKQDYLVRIEAVFSHLADRFGQHHAGWWPYIERWDHSIGMGNSVSYQGTIIAFAHTALPLLTSELQERWQLIAQGAITTMTEAMKGEPDDHNEAPWWCRDWKNAWEIYLAYSRYPEHPAAEQYLDRRLQEVDSDLERLGVSLFQPKVVTDDPERTPVTTTFRKAATFAGIVSYMVLDGNDSVKS